MIHKHSLNDSPPSVNLLIKFRSAFWWLMALSILSLNIVAATKSHANTIASDEPDSGVMILQTESRQQVAGTHLKTDISANISGLIAAVDYRQSFVNDTNEWVEGIYSFPLPEDAAIKSLKIVIGERVIVGEIKEKNQAKKIYRKAKQQGKIAALTTQQRPNLFTQKVSNIAPGDKIDVHIEFLDIVRYSHGAFEWRLPTTLTPRYIPGIALNENPGLEGDEIQQVIDLSSGGFGWAQPTDQVADADAITPPMIDESFARENPISIDIQLDSGVELADINSLYHDIDVKKNAHQHHVAFVNQTEEMNRDFVLSWKPVSSKTPKAAMFSQKIDNENFVMLMLLPPQAETASALPRDIIFIIDTSGSMQGSSIKQARSSLKHALNQLGPSDQFNIIEFNSHHSLLFQQLQPVTSQAINSAQNWVSKLNANGGTEMRGALEAAFQQLPTGERLKQIVFITDGAVGNETTLFKIIHENIADARLFTVGIGSAPNSYFMKKSAEYGRGSFEYIAQNSEIEERMKGLFKKLGSATATNIEIDWPEGAEAYPERIGDLYADEPLIAIARLDQTPDTIDVSGRTASTDWKRTLKSPTSSNKDSIATLWARAKIDAIEKLEYTNKISSEQAKKAILNTALKHKILSKFTAFIAVDKNPARPHNTDLKSKAIPNQVANGQLFQPVMYPKTATTANLSFWLGALLFVSFMLVTRMRSDV